MPNTILFAQCAMSGSVCVALSGTQSAQCNAGCLNAMWHAGAWGHMPVHVPPIANKARQAHACGAKCKHAACGGTTALGAMGGQARTCPTGGLGGRRCAMGAACPAVGTLVPMAFVAMWAHTAPTPHKRPGWPLQRVAPHGASGAPTGPNTPRGHAAACGPMATSANKLGQLSSSSLDGTSCASLAALGGKCGHMPGPGPTWVHIATCVLSFSR